VLYVLADDDPALLGWVRMRDHLREHPEVASRYAELKRRAVAEGQTAPRSYQAAKAPFLEELARKLG
jgi:GrpB-like predicted nucleotidyltransferase (UPF0157 family)